MSVEGLLDSFAGISERRRFLKRAGVASAGAVAGMLGYTSTAQGFIYHGCNLCKYPPGNCTAPSGACNWCWWGSCHCSGGSYHRNLCCERWPANAPCDDRCDQNTIICSYLANSERCSGPRCETADGPSDDVRDALVWPVPHLPTGSL